MTSLSIKLITLLVTLVTLFALTADAFSTARAPLAAIKPTTTATAFAQSALHHHPAYKSTVTSSSVQRSMASSSDDDSSSIKSPLDRPVLAALDFLAILLFAFIGTSSHNSASDYMAVLVVAVPFLLSWFATTPFLGLFQPTATNDIKTALATTAKGWIVAIPLGCVLRGIIKGYVPPLPFCIVTMIATLVVIGGTRVAYTALHEIVTEV